MLKYILNFIFLSCLLSPMGVQAQSPTGKPLESLSTTDGNKILIRWLPMDYDTWLLGRTQGYQVERYTYSVNGVRQNQQDTYDSKIILTSSLLPLTEAEWQSQFPASNSFAQLAKGVLYDPGTALPADPNLSDAVNFQEDQDTRFIFGLYAADQDFEVAKGLANALEDNNVVAGNEYLYRISINGSEEVVTAFLQSPDNIPVLTPPVDLSGVGEDHQAMLTWNIKETEKEYSNYVIERSTDGINYQSVNDLPLLFSSEEDDPEYSFYQDSLDNNTTVYSYRVRGKTPFCILGPPSDTIQVKGRPGRIPNFQPMIKHVLEKDNRNVVAWPGMIPEEVEDKILGFNILRSEKPTEGYTKINSWFRPSSARYQADFDFIPSAYYRLEVIDINNHSYLSSPKLFQRTDTIPPEPPTGLSGEFVTSNTLILTWTKNSEEDLLGYRVFSANNRTAEYTLISPQQVESETFVYEIDPEFMVDSIYLKIVAGDGHDNYSDYSSVLALARPDVIPPSRPVLYKANPTPAGIEIGWAFSGSSDVARHELQRKNINLTNWETVVTIVPEEEENYKDTLIGDSASVTNFLDPTILDPGTYQYRFAAFDLSENGSSSQLINIRPYTSGVRGTIESVDVLPRCVAPVSVDNQEGYDAVEAYILEYETEGTRNIDLLEVILIYQVITAAEFDEFKKPNANLESIYRTIQLRKLNIWSESLIAQVDLTWEYTPTGVRDYQIFRSTAGSDMMLYQTVSTTSLTDLKFEDTDVKAGHRYFYRILARHHGGGFSEMSKVKMVRVPVL